MNNLSELLTLALDGDKQGIWFFAALYCLLVMLYSVAFQMRIQFWPVAQGYLKLFDANPDDIAKAVYEYEVEGVSYQAHRVSPWAVKPSHNAKLLKKHKRDNLSFIGNTSVDVAYNPRCPEKSYLIKPAWIGIGVTFVLAFVPMLTYFLEYVF